MVRGRGLLASAWLACTVASACALAQAADDLPPAFKETAATTAPAEMIEAALDDAANRSTTARADIKVIRAEAVTWPDGSLGCPQPGMTYTQSHVAGYRIVLQAGDQSLNYHAMSRGRPVFCPAGRAVRPVPADPTG